VRVRLTVLCFITFVLFINTAPAQSPNGTVSGIVLDPSGGVIVGADLLVINDGTGVQYAGKANSEGFYVVPNIPPGTYRIQVSNSGFKTIIKPDIVIHVLDAIAINFTLPIGASSEIVTVEGGAPLINTQDAAVSTVIDRDFVESLPLNGRSFNTLLQLTPGVVIAPTNTYSPGQFSIAGQRTSANNFLIDGVSANFGVPPQTSVGISGGAAQAFSALGGTSSLVSVETLQEFRVETSSFAPEFGRSPGGQVILNTRSGTNEYHGGIYEYFRNNVLDANDWFANQAGLPRAPERHNDFGGFLGGPIQSDKTFFFASYEGARLRQPNTVPITVPYISNTVPSCSAPALIAPFLEAYPKPNGTVSTTSCTGTFIGNFSDPASLDAGSIRIDHTFNGHFSIFGRYNEAPSVASKRNNSLSEIDATDVGTRTLTLGATMALTPSILNSLRGNYSLQTSSLVSHLDSFGGAVPPDLSFLAPQLAKAGNTDIEFISFDARAYATGPAARNRGTQLNFADDLSVSRGVHQLKFGADYRAIYMNLNPGNVLFYIVSSVPNFLSTSEADIGIQGITENRSRFLFQATSLYGQDTWKIAPSLTLTYGVRWELDPAPSTRGSTTVTAWTNVNNPAAIALAHTGSPLWSTTYTNFAPRIGVAYCLTPDGDLVLRAGWGMFYDLGTDAAGYLGTTFPNSANNFAPSVPLPLTDATPFLLALPTQPPFPDGTAGFNPDLKLPRSYQWNVALEKSFQGRQTLSLTYVGQAGRDLLRQEGLAQPNSNFLGSFLLTVNSARSNYNALQLQYRRPLSNNLQALASYTLSHSLDNASNDTIEDTAISSAVISTAKDYASSSFDVRNSFSGALNYLIPSASRDRLLSHLTRNWSIEAFVVARGGFPFNAQVQFAQIAGAVPRPNLVPGQPIWIPNPAAGGGKSLNPLAFTVPPAGQQGSEGRNDIRGFGLTQVDFSGGRKFFITERLNLQFRLDAFNLFNHPNFANPTAQIGNTSTLQAPFMLNRGLGGLNPLFQEGGPRSLQLSLKLTF
jgi:hypothetical protein